jgi:prepilin-type N-terminal cleavage/methylation domain-containing protein
MMSKQTGFTLVEIAIVLVIIGLLLGGVLKGKEIIINAKVINVENSFTGISSAIYSYQDRYRSLPGDDSKAKERWPSLADTQKGNGDGGIGGQFDTTTDNQEARLFWLHLRNAKLVAGAADDQTQPTNAFGGLMGASNETVANTNLSGIYVGFQNVPGKIASILEARSDDSDPKKGGIQATEGSGQSTAAATSYDESKTYRLYFEL